MRTNPASPESDRSSSITRLPGALLHAAYGVYSLTLLATLMVVAALLALLLPVLCWRRSSTHALARLWLLAAGLRPRVTGLDSLPEGSCVVVANHSSYLDGVLMKAALPPRFGFVIKREASSMPVLGLLLRRIGSEFIDRNTRGGRQRDARRVVERAGQGHSLVFFPEGTFDSVVGLKRFHIGAFVAAARSGSPVVPAVIRGARAALPNGRIAPRPGRIEIELLPPIGGHGETPESLRDAARAQILARLDEPDVAPPGAPGGAPARAEETAEQT